MSNIKKTLGIYPGSFNPFHCGHLDVLRQAQNTFDEVIIAIGKNSEKENVTKEPFPIGHVCFEKVKVVEFSGLLSDYLNRVDYENEGSKVFLIRGLRNGDDLQYEQNQLQFIKEMYPSLMTVFFICDKKLEHISSSALRALKKVSEKDYYKYIVSPPTPRTIKWTWDEDVDGSDEFIRSGRTDRM